MAKYGNPNVFDAECYMQRYPDLEAYMEKHYAYHGQAEGRTFLSAQQYLHDNPDLAVYLEEHYRDFGQKEGRIPGCDVAPNGGGGEDGNGDTGNGDETTDTNTGTGMNNKTLMWVGIGAGLLFFAYKQKLFK